MKRVAWLVFGLLLLGCGGGGGDGTGNSLLVYATDFSMEENPLSDGGKWVNGGDAGVDWNNMRSAGGFALGTRAPVAYSDPFAILAGEWVPDQYVEGVAFCGVPNPSQFEEVEIRLRTNVSARTVTGYEVTCRCLKGDPASYLQIAKWPGPLPTDIDEFTFLFSGTGSEWGVRDGDVVRAEIVGATIRVRVNGVLVATVTDPSPVPSGSPGIGVNYGAEQDYSNFGWKSMKAGEP